MSRALLHAHSCWIACFLIWKKSGNYFRNKPKKKEFRDRATHDRSGPDRLGKFLIMIITGFFPANLDFFGRYSVDSLWQKLWHYFSHSVWHKFSCAAPGAVSTKWSSTKHQGVCYLHKLPRVMGPLCAQPQEFVKKNSVWTHVRVSCLTKKETACLAKHAWVTFTSKFLVTNCRFRPMPATLYILAVTNFRSALPLIRTVKKRSFFHILLLQKILKDAKNILPHCRCHTKTNPPCVLQLQ